MGNLGGQSEPDRPVLARRAASSGPAGFCRRCCARPVELSPKPVFGRRRSSWVSSVDQPGSVSCPHGQLWRSCRIWSKAVRAVKGPVCSPEQQLVTVVGHRTCPRACAPARAASSPPAPAAASFRWKAAAATSVHPHQPSDDKENDGPSSSSPRSLLATGLPPSIRATSPLVFFGSPPPPPPASLLPLPAGLRAMAGFSQSAPGAPAAPSPLNPGWSPTTATNQQQGVQRSTSAGSYSNSEESSTEGARARRSGGGEHGSSGVLDGLARGEIGSAYGRSSPSCIVPLPLRCRGLGWDRPGGDQPLPVCLGARVSCVERELTGAPPSSAFARVSPI